MNYSLFQVLFLEVAENVLVLEVSAYVKPKKS